MCGALVMPQQQKATRLALRSCIIMSILLIFLRCLHSNSFFVNHVVFQSEQPDFQAIYPRYCTFFNAQFIIFHCTPPSVLANWSNWEIPVQVLYGLGIMVCCVCTSYCRPFLKNQNFIWKIYLPTAYTYYHTFGSLELILAILAHKFWCTRTCVLCIWVISIALKRHLTHINIRLLSYFWIQWA